MQLVHNSYGKSAVRLMKVTRHDDHQDLVELNVNIQLSGDFTTVYTEGDNLPVLPTDTMKNTVYALAASHPVDSVESFLIHLADHFLRHNPPVSQVTVEAEQGLWQRVPTAAGQPHPWAYTGGSTEKRTCRVVQDRHGLSVGAGLKDLLVLKTKGSAFHTFKRDAFTTLKDTSDRILATSALATWTYQNPPADPNAAHDKVRTALLRCFSDHESLSVQQTLYAMGTAALAACPEAVEISITMPNRHCLPVDLQPFGLENRNEIFVPTTEPHGLISGTVRR